MILLRLNKVVFIKVLVRLFIKQAELNPQMMQKKNLKNFLEEGWKKTNILRVNFGINLIQE